MRLPLFGAPIVPSAYGQRYAGGQVVEGGRHLFVSTGLGTSEVAVRFGVPPTNLGLTLAAGDGGVPRPRQPLTPPAGAGHGASRGADRPSEPDAASAGVGGRAGLRRAAKNLAIPYSALRTQAHTPSRLECVVFEGNSDVRRRRALAGPAPRSGLSLKTVAHQPCCELPRRNPATRWRVTSSEGRGHVPVRGGISLGQFAAWLVRQRS